MISQSPPFPLNALPHAVRNAAFEIVANTGASDVIVGMTMLACMSVAAQLNFDVRLPHGAVRPTGSTLVCLAMPSQHKTTVDELVMKPFIELDSSAAKAHEVQRKAYRSQYQLWKMTQQAMQREIVKNGLAGKPTEALSARLADHEANEPVPPRNARIVYANTTHRALLEAMEGEGRFTAILSNEGETVLASPIFKSTGLLNAIWDGAPVIPLDRSKGESLVARNPRNVTFLMLQPAAWTRLMAKLGESMQANGYSTRILLGVAPEIYGHRQRAANPSYKALSEFHDRVALSIKKYCDRQTVGGDIGPLELLELEEDAKSLILRHQANRENFLSPGGYLHSIRGFVAKEPENICRIAASLHVASGWGKWIGVEAVQSAIEIVEWFSNQTLGALGPFGTLSPLAWKSQKLLNFIRRSYWQLNRPADLTDISRMGPIRPKSEVLNCLEFLKYHGFAALVDAPDGKSTVLPMLHLLPYQ